LRSAHDIEFYWDPICPFAWVTSRWVEMVAQQRSFSVDWRFLSLAILNEQRDYEKEFPPGYPALHGKGRAMLRVAAAARNEGADTGTLYTAYGNSIWDRTPPVAGGMFDDIGTPAHLAAVLQGVGLDPHLADAAFDPAHDAALRADTELALQRAGKGVGTPVVVFRPPDGLAFFGPIISRIPNESEALQLWDAVTLLGNWPGFAELKRTMRETPQLKLFDRR